MFRRSFPVIETDSLRLISYKSLEHTDSESASSPPFQFRKSCSMKLAVKDKDAGDLVLLSSLSGFCSVGVPVSIETTMLKSCVKFQLVFVCIFFFYPFVFIPYFIFPVVLRYFLRTFQILIKVNLYFFKMSMIYGKFSGKLSKFLYLLWG